MKLEYTNVRRNFNPLLRVTSYDEYRALESELRKRLNTFVTVEGANTQENYNTIDLMIRSLESVEHLYPYWTWEKYLH